MDHLGAVPVLDRADTDCSAHAEDIIAVAEGEKAVVGVPVTLSEFELRLAFAVGIDGLLLIEIDAVGHPFGLYGDTVVMQLVVRIYRRVGCPFGDGVAVPHLCALVEHGVARTDRVRGGTNLPKGSRYARLACRA